MTLKELIQNTKNIVNGRLKFDPFSRLYKSPVFKQSLHKITEEEVRSIQEELASRQIYSQVQLSSKKIILKVLRGTSAQKKTGWFFNFVLFAATVASTAATGALLRGRDPFSSWNELSYGYGYSFALLTILLFHEMAHYFTARYYKVQVSLPYFVPLFLPAFHPGTLGTFVRTRSSMPGKKALFDIGLSGPLAGFVVSLLFLWIGFSRLPGEAELQAAIGRFQVGAQIPNIFLGRNFLFDFFIWLFNTPDLPMNALYHFPFIFAGWIGLLVTAFNLLPIGQLDGGHILYALFGDRGRKTALAGFMLFIPISYYLTTAFSTYYWLGWEGLALIFIRFHHPPTMDDDEMLGLPRKILGWLSFIIFILCFSAIPIYLK